MASQGRETVSPIPYGKFSQPDLLGVCNYFGLILGRKRSRVGQCLMTSHRSFRILDDAF
jgi:hypothetical protein